MNRRHRAWIALLAALAAGCGAARTAAVMDTGPAATLSQQRDGTWRVIGQGTRDGTEALQDAMRRAEAAARQRGQRMTPLRVEPLAAGALVGANFACALTFRLEALPKVDTAGDHSYEAFEHRMRRNVEEGK